MLCVVFSVFSTRCPFTLFHEYLPYGDEQHGEHGAGDEAVHAEHGEAAKGREQDEEVRELGVAPHENRAQDIVRKADDACSVGDEDAAVPVLARGQKVQPFRADGGL